MPLQLCLKPKALLWEELSGPLQLPEMLLSATASTSITGRTEQILLGRLRNHVIAWQGHGKVCKRGVVCNLLKNQM